MLDYKLVNYKSTITNKGNTYIDLMSKVWQDYTLNNGRFVVVEKWYTARPDLVSLAVYGTDQYADIICKVNGISNPFELNEGNLLFCPDTDFIMNSCKYASGPSELVSNNNDTISSTKSVWQKPKNSKRSPNQQIVGDNNYVIDKSLGIVFY